MTNLTLKIANNTLFQLIGKVVSMSITILTTIIITRQYGREGYGEFNIMQNYPALFFIIADFGLNAIAVREISKYPEKTEKYLANILFLRLMLCMVLLAFSSFALAFLPYEFNLKLGVFFGSFVIFTVSMFATLNIVFQSKLRYDLSMIGYITGSLVILLLALGLSYLKADVGLVNFSYVIGGFISVLVNMYLVKRLGVRIGLEFDFSLIRNFFWLSLPVGLMFIFSQINFKADSILLSILPVPANLGLSQTEAVAIYGLPYKIFEVALVVPTFLMNAAYPVFVDHFKESKNRLKNTFLKIIIALATLGVVAAIVGNIFAEFAINFLGGSEFKESITVLRILVGGLILFYVSQPIGWLLVTINKQKILPFIYFLSAVINLGLNYYFIPKYSFYASSVITLISELFILIILVLVANKYWNNVQEIKEDNLEPVKIQNAT